MTMNNYLVTEVLIAIIILFAMIYSMVNGITTQSASIICVGAGLLVLLSLHQTVTQKSTSSEERIAEMERDYETLAMEMYKLEEKFSEAHAAADEARSLIAKVNFSTGLKDSLRPR